MSIENVSISNLSSEKLGKILEKYKLFDQRVDELIAKQSSGESMSGQFEALMILRTEIAELQSETSLLANKHAPAPKNSPRERNIADQVKRLIQSLIKKVAILEETAQESYQQLIPQLNQSVRGKLMKQAYHDS
ncbi:MAG: hypothetical protein AB8B55_00060 [Mariniblastus sp.]